MTGVQVGQFGYSGGGGDSKEKKDGEQETGLHE